MSQATDEIYAKILDDSAHIVVMGLGYVGLPLAIEYVRCGFQVTGLDPDAAKIASLQMGVSYVDRPTSETLQAMQESGRFKATIDPSVLAYADIVFICVPTPLSKTRDPDLSIVREAVEQIAQYQHKGMLVVLESTSYPGTTRELLVNRLTQGYRLGLDVFIGYSPERIDPGNPTHHLTNTPKLVSGITEDCARLTNRLYLKINDQLTQVSSPEVAEMAKVLENTFRAVNIGLANEVALICKKLGVDPFEVIEAAATKPFGFMPFFPGPGLGGHCIPIDPLYLSWKLRGLNSQARFIELADTINGGMPDHVVGCCIEALNNQGLSVNGSLVLILGVAYKPDVADIRESPVLPIIQKLEQMGACVSYQDPLIPEFSEHGLQMTGCNPVSYHDWDLVVITTPHKEFDLKRVMDEAYLIVDTRGVMRDSQKRLLTHEKIFRI